MSGDTAGGADVPVHSPGDDAAARRAALDPRRSFIVQAPAGSGKTELLIQRMLRLLAVVDEPEEIAAITFSRKAAAEMRRRVLQALARAAAEPRPEAEPHRALTWDLAGAALARDRARGWELSQNAVRLRVQTIDSLCASLTRQMPVLSRFGAQPEPVEGEDANALYAEAARATLALLESGEPQSADDVARLLEHLDNHRGSAEALLAAALAERDKWLRGLHGAHDREALESALERLRAEAMARAGALIGAHPDLAAELVATAARCAANLAAAGVGDSPLLACEGLSELPGTGEDDEAPWLGLTELLLTREGDLRKTRGLNKNLGFPAGESKAEKEAARTAKDRAGALLDALAGQAPVAGALHALRSLPPARYGDDQWEVLGAIARLVRRAAAELRVVFGASSRADFVEVAHCASAALGTPEAPTDLALALDCRIRHILVDEFQDTSVTQYELLEKLTAGWVPDDGRTLFLVGDPMQSIYRFRQAEVGLFLRARREGIGSVRIEPLTLSLNFRSQRGIVDWVNRAFSEVMPPVEDIGSGAVSYSASVASHAALPGEAVTVHALFSGDAAQSADPDAPGPGEDAREQEARIVARIAHEALSAPRAEGGAAPGIAILVRGRSHLARIVPALRAAGLAFRAIEIEQLGHRPVVQDLLALTRALCHAGDRLAWLTVLRAPWCGLTLADLHALMRADSYENSRDSSASIEQGSGVPDSSWIISDPLPWERLNDPRRLERLSGDGRERALRLRGVLGAVLADRLRMPLCDAVEGAWLALGGPACLAAPADLEDAHTFLDLLDALEDAGEVPDFAALDAAVERLFAAPDPDPAARIDLMTIHKAKGLEFDVVIVPGLGRGTPADDKRLFRWLERPTEHGTDLLLAPLRRSGGDADPVYEALRRLDVVRAGHEDGRLLYVAATRARHRLHLLGEARVKQKDGVREIRPSARGSLLAPLWPVVASGFEAALAAYVEPGREAPAAGGGEVLPDKLRSSEAIDARLRRLPSGWRPPALSPALAWSPRRTLSVGDSVEFSWAGETARHVGSVAHRWLQRIAEDAAGGWERSGWEDAARASGRIDAMDEALRRELAARGVAESELAEGARRVAEVLRAALADPRGRWVLGPHPEAASEQRIRAIIADDEGRIGTGAGVRTLAIDRRFRDAGGRLWIVDYKTGRHEGSDVDAFLDRERERYAPQLERYARVLDDGDGGTDPPQLGLYFPLLAGWREWPGGSSGSDG